MRAVPSGIPLVERRNGELFVEDVPLTRIAAELGTPCYVYGKAAMLGNFDEFSSAFADLPHLICVSVKANSNLSLLHLLARRGAGFDVVSGGELTRVIRAGADPRTIVYAGVGKTDAEIEQALRASILMFNVESAAELKRLDEIAGAAGLRTPAALRVNPDVDSKTHAHTNTGLDEHKFGIPFAESRELYTCGAFPNVDFVGIDCHIGSNVSDLPAFRTAFARVRQFVDEIRPALPNLRYADVGGGLAARYREDQEVPSAREYAAAVNEAFRTAGLTVILEPGRAIFANAALLLSRTVLTKRTASKRFLVLDAAFNDLIRPLLYDAYHEIVPVCDRGDERSPCDVVGPVCETADCFARGRALPEAAPGDLFAILSAGAYGFTMSSNYNTRTRPAEVLVDGSAVRVIRRRETVEELLAPELEGLHEIRR